jgi:hypothetical protein
LLAEGGGGGHAAALSLYLRLFEGVGARGDFAQGPSAKKAVSERAESLWTSQQKPFNKKQLSARRSRLNCLVCRS